MVGKAISRKGFAIATFVAAASLAAPILAWADTATPTDTSQVSGLEEIIVTARKAKEELETTPVAVTALTGAMLIQQQLNDPVDLAHAVPNMATSTTGPGPSSLLYVSIRGQAQNNGNSASDQAVGTYLDGIYIARALVGNFGFLDVSNIEVLRGPQGTLFGRNTTGGAVNVTSNQPTGDFSGNIEAGTGNYSQKYGQGTLNIPLIGNELAVRLAARYVAHDAYFTDPITGINPAELNHDITGRVTVRWAPNSMPLVLSIAADRTNERDTGNAESLMGYNSVYLNTLIPGVPLATLIPAITGYNPANYLVNHSNFYQSFINSASSGYAPFNTPFGTNNTEGLSANLDVDLGAVHMKSITGYRQSISANTEDLDGTPVDIGVFYSRYVQHQFSEELQFSGKLDKFDWIGGLYYFSEGGTEQSASQTFQVISQIFQTLVSPAFPNATINTDYATFGAESKAVYLQTNYHISDSLRATLGYRYTYDNREIDRSGRNDILGVNTCGVGADTGNAAGQPCSQPLAASFSYPAYTIGFDWEAVPGTFLYIKSSRASLAGGFNTRPVPPGASDSFQPETNRDIELGVKNESFDKRLRTNLAVFGSKVTDLQNLVNTLIQTPAGPRTTQYIATSGNAEMYGVELEIAAKPIENFEVDMSAAWLHSRYQAGSFYETQLVGTTPVLVDRSNEPVLQAPDYTFSLGATETVPVSFGKFAFHADFAYRAAIYYMYETPAPNYPPATLTQWNYSNELNRLPGYGLVNARITLDLNQPNLVFALWGKNLANKQYMNYEFNSYTGLGTSVGYQADPRTFGITANYKF